MRDRPLYQVRSLVKDHGGPFRLHVEALEIPRGQVFCLLGPTGAGKSTLLRILAGLDSANGGEASFDSIPLNGRGLSLPDRRRITMVFQTPRLLAGTVRANVGFGPRLRGVRGRSTRAETWLDRLGLTKLATQTARSLSGGQVQLVALARALAVEPDVLILDEPTAHLDPAQVAHVERVLIEDQNSRGATVIWATHNLFQARRVADRVGLLLNGELVEEATTEDFFERPCDPRAGAFVRGEMIY